MVMIAMDTTNSKRAFYVVRVNRDPLDTYAAESFSGVMETASPNGSDVLHWALVVARDAGEARLTAPKKWHSLSRRFDPHHARRLEQDVIAIWCEVYRSKLTMDEGLRRIRERLDCPEFYRLPAASQERIHGASSGAWQFISYCLTENLHSLDGRLVKSGDVPEGQWSRVDTGASFTAHTGTDRPFFEYRKKTN